MEIKNLVKDPQTNWKYILIVVILAIIVGGGILGYLKYFEKEISFPTEFPEIKKSKKVIDETANWNLYQDEIHGFKFRYPPDYTVEEEKADSKFHIVISSPQTSQIIQETLGESTDQIFITPRESPADLESTLHLPRPIQPTEEYFSSREVAANNIYLGKITVSGRSGFQLMRLAGLHGADEMKYTLFINSDGTWFVIRRLLYSLPSPTYPMIEPYDSIVGILEFT